jgi:hypothetical protein
VRSRSGQPGRDYGGPTSAVLLVGGMAATASVVQTVTDGVSRPWHALAFLIFIAVGEFARINLPGGRDAAPLAIAGALAYALVPGNGATVGQVVAVVLTGMLLGALPHAFVGRGPRLDYFARRVITIAVPAVLFRPTADGASAVVDLKLGPLLALTMAGTVILAAAVEAVLAAASRVGREASPFGVALRDELRALGGIGSAVGATGMLIALATDVMDLWAIPVFSVPLLLAHFSLRRFAEIRATYGQTIRALSRVTELGGYTEPGHVRRVNELAVAVGREMGMGESGLLDLEYAALLHDLGQLSLTDPIPGGATTIIDPTEQRRIAERGAKVIRETGVLDRVADIVERQTDPYRRPHEVFDASLPLASRIIKAVNAFDDLVGGMADHQAELDALERLRLGVAYDYDPRVVDSLARVVERTVRTL